MGSLKEEEKVAGSRNGSAERHDGGLPPLGDVDAPVTIVEFGDYRCTVCARFFATTEMQIREEFIKKGKAKMYWRDFAFLGQDSKVAAEAARCANEQGAFWAYHDALLTMKLESADFSTERLEEIARNGGLNEKEFNHCVSSGRYRDAIEKDRREGKEAGVQGTPTFFINGRKVAGAQPYEILRVIIEEEVAK